MVLALMIGSLAGGAFDDLRRTKSMVRDGLQHEQGKHKAHEALKHAARHRRDLCDVVKGKSR